MRAVVAVVAAVLAGTACAGDGRPAGSRSTPTPSTTTGCRPLRSPAPVQPPARAESAVGDVDGDRCADLVTLVDESASRDKWLLKVKLGSGDGLQIDAPGSAAVDPLRAPVIADADGDGKAEIFLESGRGASTATFTAYRMVGALLQRVVIDAGGALVTGASAAQFSSFACQGATVTTWVGTRGAGGKYAVTRTIYRWSESRLVRQSANSYTAASPGVDVTTSTCKV